MGGPERREPRWSTLKPAPEHAKMADFLLPFPLMALSILPGAASLSAFRAERLLARLRVHAPALRTLRCRDFYLVDAANTAESDLRRLLGQGPAACQDRKSLV